MKLKGIIFEDFVNYKKPCMTLEFPRCSFKCDKEAGAPICHNSPLASAPEHDIGAALLCNEYMKNDITEAICLQGLEPFDSFVDMAVLIDMLRFECACDDDIVIYTGYTEEEIQRFVNILKEYDNIIIKFGRYIPNRPHVFDDVLGVELSSDNQYAVKIS